MTDRNRPPTIRGALHAVPWPPSNAAAWSNLHNLSRSAVMRHAADLHWTAHLPDEEREQVLDHMAAYDLRRAQRDRLARQRELAHLRRLDRAADALDELRAFLADSERPAANPAPLRRRAPRRRPPTIPHLRAA